MPQATNATTTAPSRAKRKTAADARLLAHAREIAALERQIAALSGQGLSDDEWEARHDPLNDRIEDLIAEMADTPAATLLGVAAKAARLCHSLGAGRGCIIPVCEAPLAESLAADLARLAPEVAA